MLGNHYASRAWMRAGCHQLSCGYGSFTLPRHNAFRTVVLEGLARAGAVISKDEIMVSAVDNKRADGCLWHPSLSERGIALDFTVWSDYTLARLPTAAATPQWTLLAAQKYKSDKYTPLCDAINLDFAALAANPHGGWAPDLVRLWRTVWDARLVSARTAGLPTHPIASQERRALEAERCSNRRIFMNSALNTEVGSLNRIE